MHGEFEQLHGDDEVLIMYLAGELPAQVRQEVQQRLSMDSNLQQKLDELRNTQDLVFDAMARIDVASPMGVQSAASLRSIFRMIQQYSTRRLTTQVPDVAALPRRGSRFLRYGIISLAAALLIGFGTLIVIQMTSGSPQPVRPVPQGPFASDTPVSDEEKIRILNDSVDDSPPDNMGDLSLTAITLPPDNLEFPLPPISNPINQ